MENTKRNGNTKRTQRDYGLAFKLQVVDEVEKGQLTYKQAQTKYGIQGRSTVLVWLRKHGRLDWKSLLPMKHKSPPDKRIRELQARIRRLEAEKEILNVAIDVADELLETNIRKKYLPQLLNASTQLGQSETEAPDVLPQH